LTNRLIDIGTDLGSCWRRIAEIQDQCHELPQDGSLAEGRKLNRLKQDEQCLTERTYALEAVTTQLRAGSLPAAMVQAVMAHRFVRELMESDLKDWQRQAACRSVERLLYSIVDCLEAETKERREAIFGTAYMPRDQDPFRCLEDAAGTPCVRPAKPDGPARGRPRAPRREPEKREEASF
jgi:hypothetical protein